jgi:hypothetical protein
MRQFLTMMLGVLTCGVASAQTGGPLRVELSLAEGKTIYRIA